ncbi:neuropeptide SIFamide [Plodia interpunctella]|uniref:neuropeptide SIFamide n=1 Tax=Plodia interpunctella TaxID=58824 RepID=UPI00236832F5|nr:neuropeptide SIFamide [Plodia interpunctella]
MKLHQFSLSSYQDSSVIKVKMRTFVFLFVAILCLAHTIEATYRKVPFNGSIFGKRGVVEYDSTGKAMSALCEIASETCQAWYQTVENK